MLRAADIAKATSRTWALRHRVMRHRLLGCLLLFAALLRTAALLAYHPVLWFNDAFEYVSVAIHPAPYPIRPNGYAWMLQALEPAHSFALVAAVQHLMGLCVGVLLYLLIRGFGLPAWAGCLAAVPVLFDSHEIEIEHIPLSDTLFTLLLVVVLFIGLVSSRPGWGASATMGLLLAAAMLTRPAALPVILVIALFLLFRRVGWLAFTSFALLLTAPLLAYGLWYRSVHGAFALTSSTGIQMYGRVAGFADCNVIKPPPRLAVLCPDPPDSGQPAPNWIWHPSPLTRLPGFTFTPQKEKLAREFAQRAVLAQPRQYAAAVIKDIGRGASWHRGPYPNAYTVAGYDFSDRPWPITSRPLDAGGTQASVTTEYERGDARTGVTQPFAGLLIAYQRFAFVQGTALTIAFLLALTGLLARTQPAPRVRRAPLLLVTLSGLALALGPIMTVQLDYRYVLPSSSFAAVAAVLGTERIIAWMRGRHSSRRGSEAPRNRALPSPMPPVAGNESPPGSGGPDSAPEPSIAYLHPRP